VAWLRIRPGGDERYVPELQRPVPEEDARTSDQRPVESHPRFL
jgi:hypothetical protein